MVATFFRANDNNDTKYFLHTERAGQSNKQVQQWMTDTIATHEALGYYTKLEHTTDGYEIHFLCGESNSIFVQVG